MCNHDPCKLCYIKSLNQIYYYISYSVPRFKQRFCFVECNNENLFDVLDILKVADTVLFVVSVEGIQSEGELLLTTTLAQGLPTTVVTLVDLLNLPPKVRIKKLNFRFKMEISLFAKYIGYISVDLVCTLISL